MISFDSFLSQNSKKPYCTQCGKEHDLRYFELEKEIQCEECIREYYDSCEEDDE
jgi:NADH pyrophosphatase NudC (nudix superfamily)